MARPKKDYIALHVKADAAIMKRFEEYCDEMGQTKTIALERILSAYLDEHDAQKAKAQKTSK